MLSRPITAAIDVFNARPWQVLPLILCLGALNTAARAQPASLFLSNRAYTRIPTSPDFAMQQFTLSVWLKPTGPGESGGGTLVSKSGRPDSGSLLCSWWMGWSSSTGNIIGLVVHEYAASGRFITSNAAIALGQEAHAALTFDGVTLRLYINGVLDQQEPYGFSGVYYSTEDVMIGAFNSNSGYTFNRFQGNLDDVSIWSRALSAAEIAALASCGPVESAAGLVAHLPFTDLQLTDTSGHGHSATAVGAIAYGPELAPLGACACSIADITGIGGPPSIPDGLITGDDFNAFISAFAAGDPLADITGIGGPPSIPDGLITGDDFNAFIGAFAAGCP